MPKDLLVGILILVLVSVAFIWGYNVEKETFTIPETLQEDTLAEKKVEYLRRISVSLEDISREMRRINR